MYNIIKRSSTNICWTTLVVLCKWLHCDLWPFPQVSDPGPLGPSCLLKHLLLWNHSLDLDQTSQKWSLGVQMVLIGCICKKIGFQNAIFKNLLVWNYKDQSFHNWYIASSRGPLPNLFKFCRWGQNWPRPWGHNFTLNYIRKSSNGIFSSTANGNLSKLNRNGPWWSPTKIVQIVLIGCICRSRGQKNRFSKCNFQISSCLKLQSPKVS